MIDATTVRAHQHAAGQKKPPEAEALGRSRGGFTTKLQAAVDAPGNPLGFTLTTGQHADIAQAETLVAPWTKGLYAVTVVIADKSYDSAAFVAFMEAWEAESVISSRHNRKEPREIVRHL